MSPFSSPTCRVLLAPSVSDKMLTSCSHEQIAGILPYPDLGECLDGEQDMTRNQSKPMTFHISLFPGLGSKHAVLPQSAFCTVCDGINLSLPKGCGSVDCSYIIVYVARALSYSRASHQGTRKVIAPFSGLPSSSSYIQ